jgi:cytochrome b
MTSPSTDTAPPTPVTQPLWDAPVRLLHALMVLSVAGAWLTAEAEGWRALHISFGLTLAGAMVLRLLWGFIGTPPARFTSFVRGPAAVAAHLRELLAGRAGPHAGHNPAGGWAVLALLAAGLAAAASGWLAWRGGEVWEEVHEALANGLLLLAGVHVAAVLLMSRLARDRLVPAMLTGRKAVPAGTPPTRAMHRGVAAVLLVAMLGFWAWSLGPASPWRDARFSTKAGWRCARRRRRPRRWWPAWPAASTL